MSSACSRKTRCPCRINDGEKRMPNARQDSRTLTPTNMKATQRPPLYPTRTWRGGGVLGNFCATAPRTVHDVSEALHRGDRRTYFSSPPVGFLYEIPHGV